MGFGRILHSSRIPDIKHVCFFLLGLLIEPEQGNTEVTIDKTKQNQTKPNQTKRKQKKKKKKDLLIRKKTIDKTKQNQKTKQKNQTNKKNPRFTDKKKKTLNYMDQRFSTIWIRGFQEISVEPTNLRVHNSWKNETMHSNAMQQ